MLLGTAAAAAGGSGARRGTGAGCRTANGDPDGPGTDNVTRAASNLSRANAGGTILSLPLRKGGEIVGLTEDEVEVVDLPPPAA